MNKQEFLDALREGLCGLPENDIDERIAFYSEMIDDLVEDGLEEAAAVESIGTVDSIVLQVVDDIPLSKLVKEKIKPKNRLGAWAIVFLALGSPIWFSLLISAFAVVLSIFISLWAVIISLWAVFVALVGSALGCILAGAIFAFYQNSITGIAVIGAGVFCAGLSILFFFGCKAATKGFLWLAKKTLLGLKRCFVGKENV